MLSREKFEEIAQALKNRATSSRSVARTFGISHTLANKIRRRPERVRIFDAPTVAQPFGEFRRCPRCGAKTKSPCVYCAVKDRLRALAETFKNAPSRNGGADDDADADIFLADPFELELSPDEFERYREVRRWRESRADPCFEVVPSDWPWLAETNDERPSRPALL